MHNKSLFSVIVILFALSMSFAESDFGYMTDIISGESSPGCFSLVHNNHATPLYLDKSEYPAVVRAAQDLQLDIERVTSVKPLLLTTAISSNTPAVIIGTLGKNAFIDRLVQSGKINTESIAGQWESYIIAVVDNPLPNISKALVIISSDRRGTIYGIYEISRQIGVSPWYWWADVPIPHQDSLYVMPGSYHQGPPAVKYRGIFINDEDWGLHQWAIHTFEKHPKGIGPKTYEKVFELMLRLRLNYFWPAMHECSREFASIPENVELAHYYGIAAGASHCEPMLFNNTKWDEKKLGKWDYAVNRDTIYSTWQNYAQNRGDKEAVWTIGMRGIHDRGMQGVRDSKTRIATLEQIFADQRSLLDKYVTKEWGPVAQAFVPYKEVLSLYDAGLKVPDDVTLVWVDDNFGYIRRLSSPDERKRSGGSGVYYHISYYGGPHSYLWINSTAPALLWEEFHKAWENQAQTLWMLNVGDIKPAEIGIDYFSRFAWNADSFGPNSQPLFLRDFTAGLFGDRLARPIADLLAEFYRLGTIRKPELMVRTGWALSMPEAQAIQLRSDYKKLLETEADLAARIPDNYCDTYTQLVGFPARILASTGLIFMADRSIQFGDDVAANESEITRLRAFINSEVDNYNQNVASGKWNHMMPGAVTRKELIRWSSQVQWPWGEKPRPADAQPLTRNTSTRSWRPASSADRKSFYGKAQWTRIDGLGSTAKALALKPANIEYSWQQGDKYAPTLEFDFVTTDSADSNLLIDFLPTFRICPGMKLRVAVSIDDQPSILVEVPGSSGAENEYGRIRYNAVQSNCTQADVKLPELSPGTHTLKIQAVDPGIVIDRISLPQ